MYNCFMVMTNNFLTFIYYYLDPLYFIKKQIIMKDYHLNAIMYNRMEKVILKLALKKNAFDNLIHIPYTNGIIYINECKQDNKYFQEKLLYAVNRYKETQLWNINRPTYICGLNPQFPYCYKSVMIKDLNYVNNMNENYNTYSTKEIYKLWVKI